ncbi:MAG: MFS transporter [Ardenticatenaceae bacterium]|nr:MFS transporter [Ardenticatenaceae bacterium]MCB9446454.1 MFS transporter [Ardenticatenaceae bacterium]
MNLKRLAPALFIVFANLIGATIILPILPLFAVDQLGGTPFQAVLLDTAYYGAKFVAAPFLGRWSDRYGRRPILILSQLGTVLSFGLFILALPLGRVLDGVGLSLGLGGGLVMLYVARLLDGATGGNSIIAQAYVSDITSDEDRTQALGLLAAALGVGFIFGPAVGGILAARWGVLAPFYGGAIIAAAALLLTIVMLPESLPVDKRSRGGKQRQQHSVGRQALANPSFLLILAIGFIATLCFAAISPTFALYADRVLFTEIGNAALISRNVGLMFTLMGLTAAVTQGLLIKPLVKRLGERRLVVLGQFALLASSLLIPLTANPALFVTGLIPFVFGYGLTDPTLQALITRLGQDDVRGQLLGTYQSGLSLAYILGPIWAGFVFERIAPQAVWWGTAVLFFPAFLLSLVLVRQSSRKLVTGTD